MSKQETYTRKILLEIEMEIPVECVYSDSELFQLVICKSKYPEIKIRENCITLQDVTTGGVEVLKFAQINESYFSDTLLTELAIRSTFIQKDKNFINSEKEFFIPIYIIEKNILPTYQPNTYGWKEIKNLLQLLENFQYLHVTTV